MGSPATRLMIYCRRMSPSKQSKCRVYTIQQGNAARHIRPETMPHYLAIGGDGGRRAARQIVPEALDGTEVRMSCLLHPKETINILLEVLISFCACMPQHQPIQPCRSRLCSCPLRLRLLVWALPPLPRLRQTRKGRRSLLMTNRNLSTEDTVWHRDCSVT